MTARPRGRRPGNRDTRQTILAAAGDLFAEVGYERASIRAVAARAGVDPALIHHYFGTKEGLLAAVLQLPIDPAQLLAGTAEDPHRAGAEIVRRVLGILEDESTRHRMLGLLRTALSHERAAAALRDLFSTTLLAELERVVADDTADLRASLIGTQMGGLMLGRYVLRVPALADATVDDLVAAVGPAIQHYVTGSLVAGDGGTRPSSEHTPTDSHLPS